MEIGSLLASSVLHLREGAAVQLSGDRADARRFKMLGYTGAPVIVLGLVVVFDLSGIQSPAGGVMPILKDHDPQLIVGQSESIRIDDGVMIEGTLSRVTAAAQDIVKLADDGFPWQASVRLETRGKIDRIGERETVTVNGRKLEGPLYVVRKTVLRESSFCALGADDATKTIVLNGDGKGLVMATLNPVLAEAVKSAREDFKKSAKFMHRLACPEKDFIEQTLFQVKMSYTQEELKLACPDLFK